MSSEVLASGEQVELQAGGLRATVVSVGAGLRLLRSETHELLDGHDADEPAFYAQGQALIPWPNRVDGGRYEFGGRAHQLPLTEPEAGTAIHGLVRWAAFAVTERAGDAVTLEHLIHPQAGWPFALAVRVRYALSPGGIEVVTTGTNAGRRPLPFGAGFHPYLSPGPAPIDDVALRIPAATVLVADERGIPTGERRALDGGPDDFREPRVIGDVALDTAYADLQRDADGRARVRLEPAHGQALTLWMDETFTHVMAFTGDTLPEPARRRRSLGVEPMTCPPNALRSGEDLIVLDPGESVTCAWGIDVGAA